MTRLIGHTLKFQGSGQTKQIEIRLLLDEFYDQGLQFAILFLYSKVVLIANLGCKGYNIVNFFVFLKLNCFAL